MQHLKVFFILFLVVLSSEPVESIFGMLFHGIIHGVKAWLHSSVARGQTPGVDVPEAETLSVGSSSGGSSLPDQGYAASEGTGEAEDSAISSPSDTLPTSPDGSLSLDGGGGGVAKRDRGGEKLTTLRDNSSDSDEGCATWGSRHRDTDLALKKKADTLKGNYDADAELTAQLNQTLADLEADLAEISHMDIVSSKETSYRLSTDSNEVPVSLVDMDVPVTTIDEVLEDYEQNTSASEEKTLTRVQSVSNGLNHGQHTSGEVQNKNNNALTTMDTREIQQPAQAMQPQKSLKTKSMNATDKDQKGNIEKKAEESRKKTCTVKADKLTTNTVVESNIHAQKPSEQGQVTALKKSNTLTVPEKKHSLPITRSVSEEEDEEVPVYRAHRINANTAASHSKITRNPTSRFGVKTFTVVPPKTSVTHCVMEKPPITVTSGAIKIDEQGNMVNTGFSRNKCLGLSESGINSMGSPHLGKAKTFWSSTERQDIDASHYRGLSEKECISDAKNTAERQKMPYCSSYGPAETARSPERVKEIVKEKVKVVSQGTNGETIDLERKVIISEDVCQPTNKPHSAPALPNLKRDLSFLKPTMRTSSQYLASTITKNTHKNLAKPEDTPDIPRYSRSLKSESFSYQKGGRSIQVNPHRPSQSPIPDSREVTSKTAYPAEVKISISHSEGQRDSEEGKLNKGGPISSLRPTNGSSKSDMAETVNTKQIRPRSPIQGNMTTNDCRANMNHSRPRSPTRTPTTPLQSRPLQSPINGRSKTDMNKTVNTKQIRPRSPIQGTMTANDHSANMNHSQPRSPSPTSTTSLQSAPLLSPTTQVAAFKPASQFQANPAKETTQSPASMEPLVSVTMSDCSDVPSDSQQVTVFGPVKRFRPVICKSVEKETSLHSSLMDAIQTGGARDRLKKISGPGPSSPKTMSYAEEENERCALLAALRSQNNSGRLRKTKSVAAHELEKLRNDALEENVTTLCDTSASSLPSPPPVSCPAPPFSSPPAFAPPPPTPPPPPPPPVAQQLKPSGVVRPSDNNHMDPALAREAMMQAIRSGSAAERLKKVSAPTKTVQINGRLGTIQASSSTVSQL